MRAQSCWVLSVPVDFCCCYKKDEKCKWKKAAEAECAVGFLATVASPTTLCVV